MMVKVVDAYVAGKSTHNTKNDERETYINRNNE